MNIVLDAEAPVKGQPATGYEKARARLDRRDDPEQQLARVEARCAAAKRPGGYDPNILGQPIEIEDRPLRRLSHADLSDAKRRATTVVRAVDEEAAVRKDKAHLLSPVEILTMRRWVDRWMAPMLKGAELAVVTAICDRTLGWSKLAEQIPASHLVNGQTGTEEDIYYRPPVPYSRREIERVMVRLTERRAILRSGRRIMLNLPLDLVHSALDRHPSLASLVSRQAIEQVLATEESLLVPGTLAATLLAEIAAEADGDERERLTNVFGIMTKWKLHHFHDGWDSPTALFFWLARHVACQRLGVPRPWVP